MLPPCRAVSDAGTAIALGATTAAEERADAREDAAASATAHQHAAEIADHADAAKQRVEARRRGLLPCHHPRLRRLVLDAERIVDGIEILLPRNIVLACHLIAEQTRGKIGNLRRVTSIDVRLALTGAIEQIAELRALIDIGVAQGRALLGRGRGQVAPSLLRQLRPGNAAPIAHLALR